MNDGKRRAVNDKISVLRIMYCSPQAFKMLRRVFSSPGRTTHLMLLGKAFGNLEPGFSNKWLALLKIRVESMNKCQCNCILVFDEMFLKQHLDYDKNIDKIIGIQPSRKPVN